MKKKISLAIFLPVMLLFAGCSKDFLKEGDIDKVRPATTEALNQLLTGEAYPLDIGFHTYIEMLTDDVQANYYNSDRYIAVLEQYGAAFTWQPDMFDKLREQAAANISTYETYYQKIKGCNVVLDYIDQVSGTTADKQNVKGQALALRAYYYLMLVNLYGKPYGATGTNPDTDLGVPLMLSSEVKDVSVGRSSLKGVYQQIETDLLTAIDLLPPAGANNIYRMSKPAAQLLASRFYLYMNNWDKCIEYADQVIAGAPVLKDLNTATGNFFGISNPLIAGSEVIWAYGFRADYAIIGAGIDANAKAPYTISDDLLATYDPADLRLKYYFNQALYITATLNTYKSGSGKANLTTGTSSNGTAKAFRTSEAYLNRAEARLQKAVKGDVSGIPQVLDDINAVRRNRISTAAYQAISITDPAALFTLYKAERRRELCFEDQRWFDLRRWGMPALEHHFQLGAVDQAVQLQAGDKRYTLQFSRDVMARNPNLVQNP